MYTLFEYIPSRLIPIPLLPLGQDVELGPYPLLLSIGPLSQEVAPRMWSTLQPEGSPCTASKESNSDHGPLCPSQSTCCQSLAYPCTDTSEWLELSVKLSSNRVCILGVPTADRTRKSSIIMPSQPSIALPP